jgi:signal transduction histidine kinase
VQEALTNAAKHAKAGHIEVRLQAEAGAARVQVIDDGAGFAPQDAQHSTHGLLGMEHRVESCGGHLEVHSAPGQGTRIDALLPTLPAPNAAAEHTA